MRASERAYRMLRDEIVRWELPAGAPLAEVELAGRLEMSRTPVREALAKLVADGLVVAVGGRGLEVAPMDSATIVALYELRQALEAQAARLAARRGDPAVFAPLAAAFAQAPGDLASPQSTREDPHRDAYYALVEAFDRAIDTAIANDHLAAALAGVRTHLARVRRAAKDNPTRLEAAAREHLAIAEAITAGDEELAAAATLVHLDHSLRNALNTGGFQVTRQSRKTA